MNWKPKPRCSGANNQKKKTKLESISICSWEKHPFDEILLTNFYLKSSLEEIEINSVCYCSELFFKFFVSFVIVNKKKYSVKKIWSRTEPSE